MGQRREASSFRRSSRKTNVKLLDAQLQTDEVNEANGTACTVYLGRQSAAFPLVTHLFLFLRNRSSTLLGEKKCNIVPNENPDLLTPYHFNFITHQRRLVKPFAFREAST